MSAPADKQPGGLPEQLELDVRGRPCPVPIIEAAKAMRGLAPGGLLVLRGDAPGLGADLKAWCETTGHPLLALRQELGEGGLVAQIRKAGSLG